VIDPGIDLHLHTTASDGRLRPSALVALAARAGLRVISVTDHDTVAGVVEAQETAGAHGIRLVTGIEMTAVDSGRRPVRPRSNDLPAQKPIPRP
jgi:predicted metal-dependent phosphoesterase TrpH